MEKPATQKVANAKTPRRPWSQITKASELGGAPQRRSMGRRTQVAKTNRKENKLPVTHSAQVMFAEALQDNNYRLHSRSLSYDAKKATDIRKQAVQMETIMKPYKFKDSKAVTIRSFLGQSGQAKVQFGHSEWL